MENKEKKKMSKKLLIIIGIVLLALIVAVIAFACSMLIKYHNTSYEYEPPVERENEYIIPDYPEIIIDTDGSWQEGVDETISETIETNISTESAESDSLDPVESEEAIETAAETEAETEAETKKVSETEKAVETVYKPAETLAPVVNVNSTPQDTTANTQPLNTDASFANSANAVSVYGKVPIYKVKQKDPDIINILVMGTDSRDVTADRGRSDTMIIVSYNTKTGSVKLTSLLRDSLVPIEGHDWNRINTAYFFGGVGLAINTVNQLYNLDIQNFIVIDLNGALDFIDYIGGVDLTFTEEEAKLYSAYTGKEISAGLNHVDSNLALSHMRNRAIGNDFGRTQRQRDTITAVINQVITQKSVTEIYDIVNYTFSLIKTNISATDLVSLAASVLANASNLQIESQNVPYSDAYQFAWYNGMAIISYNISDAASRIDKFIYGN